MVAQHFFVGKRYLGFRAIETYQPDSEGLLRVANSYLFVCSKCKAVWATVMVDHFDSYCQPLSRNCPQHAMFAHEGFLSSEWEPLVLDSNWPIEAVKHDFEVALSRAEKETL